MPSDPKADLIYAILAMDAYNRGYGSGVTKLFVPEFDANGNATNEVTIGNYSIIRQSNTATTSAAFAAGFYAIAYKNTTTGETVISYRGTDFNGSLFHPFVDSKKGGSDLLNGYGLAFGSTTSAQSVLAAAFYDAVNPGAGTVTLTGHSLGGGLAG
jgi:hypothetical protein